ncbi:MAG: Stk1 family PASTA domain-containing Ser/Thr kinase [Clostridia bacterium]|nr:Stk1 family PASTA domain-containing Ser/Thr kinase [Clostridia bacterium]
MKQLIGSIVNNRYQIRSTLGIGGMSVVFRAYDLMEDREVSLKVLRADRLGDQESRRRFYNESRAIALMSHPNIVNVHDVNFEGRLQYIVMEYIDGVTLKDRMDQKGALSPEEAIHYLRQILNALSHAHERGVVHHDIKPENILLLSDATVKVTDFGIASVPNFEDNSMSDETVGSVHYISPEQARGDVTDKKSDLYSVGVMMYAMLTGKLPFDAPSPVDVARMQVEKPPYPPCKLIPQLPIGFQQVIFRAMAKNPSQRYQDAASMLRDLEKLEEHPEATFPYPKEYRVPGRKNEKLTGIAGFFRSMYPDDEETYLHVRNSQLSVICGLLLSVLLVFSGVGIMVAVVSNLYQEYVNVPQYVGMAYDEIEANYDVAKNFKFNLQYEFDNAVESGVVLEQSPSSGSSVVSGSEITLVISKGGKSIAVPDLTGKTEVQAIAALKNAGLTYIRKTEVGNASVDEGIVLRCEPTEGTEVTEGTAITIYVNVRAAVTEAIMPQLVGYDKETAVTALYKKGLTSVSINEVYSDTVPVGQVISQSAPADSIVPLSETVTIAVSKGAEPEE